jgi:hypothetical protein
MNKIEELIQQHCPNGVEFKELGKIAKWALRAPRYCCFSASFKPI